MSDFNLPGLEYIDECVEYSKEDWDRAHAYFRERGSVSTKQMMDAYLQPTIEQMEQRRLRWLEEYQKWSKESLLKQLEEMSKPTSMMDYLRYCYPTIEILPVRHHPYVAEGTPRFSPLEMHQATTRLRRSARRIMAAHRECNRARRKHRAAFRRRKRGLA